MPTHSSLSHFLPWPWFFLLACCSYNLRTFPLVFFVSVGAPVCMSASTSSSSSIRPTDFTQHLRRGICVLFTLGNICISWYTINSIYAACQRDLHVNIQLSSQSYFSKCSLVNMFFIFFPTHSIALYNFWLNVKKKKNERNNKNKMTHSS